jgi:hypothetical protein
VIRLTEGLAEGAHLGGVDVRVDALGHHRVVTEPGSDDVHEM